MKGNSITALDGWNSTISNDGKTKNEIWLEVHIGSPESFPYRPLILNFLLNS